MASENPKCLGVVFSDRAYKDIETETYDKDPVETGGILLGHVLSTGHWVVVEVIPPGNNSTHQYAYFEYDEHFVNQVADQIAGKYEQKLELLGLWHRHPGSMDFFSGTDDGTNKKFAEINPAYGAISGLVNIDPEFRMTMYHVDSPLDYTKVETFVGDDIIPPELLKLKEGVTFEDIDAIKKPKTRSEQSPAASQQQTSQQTTQQPRQTTPNREEPRRTTQNRENHEKPQVVIQRPETLTGVFKKLILEHTTAFCFLVASVVVVLAGVFIFSSSQKTELRKEEIAAETKKLEEERNAKEAEIKKAEEERKTEQAKAEQAKADAKKAEEERKAEQAKAQADTEKAKAAAAQAQAQAQAEKANASAVAMSEEGREKENAPSERQDAGNPAAPNTPAGNGNNNEKECAKLLENDGDFKKAEQYYKNELLNHQGGSSYKKHLENLKKVHTKVSNCNEQKQEVQDLINKIDPEKLKQKVEKADCNQKEDCKVLDTINTCNSCNAKGKYEDPIKKWEEKCKIKCSKK